MRPVYEIFGVAYLSRKQMGSMSSIKSSFRAALSPTVAFASFVAIVLMTSLQACGASYSWAVFSGDWSVASNWGGTALPSSSDNAYVINGGTANITLAGAVCNYLYLGDPSSTNAGTIQMSSSSLSAAYECLGNNGTGTFAQSGGMNDVSNDLCLGYETYSSGSYTLSSSGVLSVAGNEYVGDGGNGTFAQSGGTNVVGSYGNLSVGNNPSFSGAYYLSGPGLLSAANENVGNFSIGTFTQTGGTNQAGNLSLGCWLGSSGTYSLSGSGVLTASFENVGSASTGTFNQTGGTNNLSSNGYLYLGNNPGVSGAYNLNGSGALSAYQEYVGSSGTGTFNQSGGINNIGSLFVGNFAGNFAGSSGTYVLSSSGVLTTNDEYVGNSGTGTFTQSGGLNSVGFLSIGNLGRYQFSGGTLQITGGGLANQGVFDATQSTCVLTVAGSAIIDFSQATLVNTGSMSLNIGPNSLLLLPAGYIPATAFASYSNLGLTHNVGTPLTIAAGQGFSGNGAIADFVNCQGTISAVAGGSINLNGGVSVSGTGNVNLGNGSFTVNDSLSGIAAGSLSAFNEIVGTSGTGTFSQSGGTNNLGNGSLYVGYSTGSSGIYSLSGCGVLSANTECLAFSSTGAFNQTSGSNFVGYLSIGDLGRYQFSGGTLQINGSGLANQGDFDATGSLGVLTVNGSAIVNLSQAKLNNTSSMSVSIGPNSLLLLPASFDPAVAFGSYNIAPTSLAHNIGTPLTIAAGQGFSGNGSIADFVNCQGTISAVAHGSVNLNGGVSVSGTGNVNLGSGSFTVSDSQSGVAAGSLWAAVGYVGYCGTGTFTQSGGASYIGYSPSLTSDNGLHLGYNSTSSGNYNLNGSGVLFASVEYLGNSGTGTFSQSGGTNNVGNYGYMGVGLYLGYNLGSSGNYNLSGSGVLATYTEYVGYSGTGAFSQTGGTNNISGYPYSAYVPGEGLYLGRAWVLVPATTSTARERYSQTTSMWAAPGRAPSLSPGNKQQAASDP